MTAFLRRLRPDHLAGQIALLILAAIIVFHLTMTTIQHFTDPDGRPPIIKPSEFIASALLAIDAAPVSERSYVLAAREVVAPVGMKVAMTGAEFDLLHALCEHPNRVLTRDQLISLTHGPAAGPFERSIDTLISRLRQKIETDVKNPKLIQTVRSEGYMFTTPVTRS